jgi:hypothetical protein
MKFLSVVTFVFFATNCCLAADGLGQQQNVKRRSTLVHHHRRGCELPR